MGCWHAKWREQARFQGDIEHKLQQQGLGPLTARLPYLLISVCPFLQCCTLALSIPLPAVLPRYLPSSCQQEDLHEGSVHFVEGDLPTPSQSLHVTGTFQNF